MVSLEWDCERADGVTLVSLYVASERECRVRIANRLDGPVWPPRRRGQPAVGWTDGEFTGTVPADGRLTVGYATSAQPAEPPAEIVSTGPPGERDDGASVAGGRLADGGSETGDSLAVEETPAGVVRSLGDPVVPRDCVPVPDERTGTDRPAAADGSEPAESERESVQRDTERRRDGSETGRRPSRPPTDRRDGDALLVPGAVRAWLRDVERRRAAAADARDVGTEATTEHAADLADAAAADRRALAWVERRIDEVTRRTDGDEVTRRTDGEGVR